VPIQYAIAKTPLSLGLTPEIDWTANGSGSGHHAAMVQVVSLGAQLSQKFSILAELWGQWDWDRLGTRRQYSVDAALAYLAGKDLQLDAGANFGLNRNTPDLELYTGVSARF
jgi:hypothetical protein